MESTDIALRGTAATPELWHAAYMMLVFALLSRGLHAWPEINGRPLGWESGLQDRRRPAHLPHSSSRRPRFQTAPQDREVAKNLMGLRAFKICDFRIAQVVILAYIAMVL